MEEVPPSPDVSPLRPEEVPTDEYFGDKQIDTEKGKQKLKKIAKGQLREHDFAVYNPTRAEQFPIELKRTCNECEDVNGAGDAICQNPGIPGALTLTDKNNPIKLLKKCEQQINKEIETRLNAGMPGEVKGKGAKWYWEQNNPGKPFPLDDEIDLWDSDIASFTKEAMKGKGFNITAGDPTWGHLDAIYVLNKRKKQCKKAISKIKKCEIKEKKTKSAAHKMTDSTFKGKTKEEQDADEMALRKLLAAKVAEKASATQIPTQKGPTLSKKQQRAAKKSAKGTKKTSPSTAATKKIDVGRKKTKRRKRKRRKTKRR